MHFAMLDTETTGLDPENDYLLEIAWVVLDQNLQQIGPERTFLVDHGNGWGEVYSQLKSNEVVRNMHEHSGLLSEFGSGDERPLSWIARILYEDLASLPRGESTHLGGFSIGFDKSFLSVSADFDFIMGEHGPLHHRVFDLSSIKLLYQLAGLEIPKPKNDNPHRALSDVWESVEQARMFRNDLRDLHAIVGGGL